MSSTPTGRRRGRPGYDQESLLNATVEVFTEKGYDGASMEDLSRHLGISKSAIYHHVSSKDELLDLAVSHALDALDKAADETRMIGGSAMDRLEHLVRASVGVLVSEKPFVTLLLRVRGNTEVERRALARRKAFDRYVAALVTEAIADGSVRSDLEPAVTARLLFGMVNSLVDWVRPSTPAAVTKLATTMCTIAFDGIRTPTDG